MSLHISLFSIRWYNLCTVPKIKVHYGKSYMHKKKTWLHIAFYVWIYDCATKIFLQRECYFSVRCRKVCSIYSDVDSWICKFYQLWSVYLNVKIHVFSIFNKIQKALKPLLLQKKCLVFRNIFFYEKKVCQYFSSLFLSHFTYHCTNKLQYNL